MVVLPVYFSSSRDKAPIPSLFLARPRMELTALLSPHSSLLPPAPQPTELVHSLQASATMDGL